MSMPCVLLEWDSAFFGFPIAKVSETILTADLARAAIEWSTARNVRCLYLLADAGSSETATIAHSLGFRMVDVRVELSVRLAPLGGFVAQPSVRRANESDAPALAEIARKAHYDSRFFFDGMFPKARSEDLFATWISADISGRADA